MWNLDTILRKKQMVTGLIFGLAAAVLAFEPVAWLIGTWRDPAYDSQGFLVFLLAAGLFAWSVTSPRTTSNPVETRRALILLAATALLRLTGQMFAIHIIGALALVIDVYALATLAGLAHRQRPISPGWLAVCFLFALPLERVMQHTVGFGLQLFSAGSACLLLGGLFDNVHCQGVRILIEGKDVLVDLPCSGARALLLLQLFFAACMAVCRPSFASGIFGLCVTLFSSVWINIFRIMVLAVGIVHPDWVWGVNVMAEPAHSLIGLTGLALGCIPILVWARSTEDAVQWACRKFAPQREPSDSGKPSFDYSWQILRAHPLGMALGFLILSAGIVSLPRTPVDVARPNMKIQLPLMIDGQVGFPTPLLPKEQMYFTQYGGAAAKASYGEHSLLVIRTSSPLRHLHSPDECLRGLGFEVRHLGISYESVPTAVYSAVHPNGSRYRIAVSFVSDRGTVTSNVSETVWRWMQDRESVWTAVQRISPWEADATITRRWDRAVLTALDISLSKKHETFIKENTP